MNPAVEEHFSRLAPRYRSLSDRLWVGWWVRGLETRAVMAAAGDLAGRSVLDLGCGRGHYGAQALRAGARRVVGVDGSGEMVASLPPPIQGVRADASTLRLSERFDLVICAGLLEFVRAPEEIVSVAWDHLRPGGALVLLVPRRDGLGVWYRRWHATHGVQVRLFGADELRRLGDEGGWSGAPPQRAGPLAQVVRWTRPVGSGGEGSR